MRQVATDWIENRVRDDQNSSLLQIWVKSDGDWENYFSLGTTHELAEFEEQIDGGYIVCRRGTVNDLLEFIPVGRTSRAERARVELSSIGDESYTATKATDVRVERSYSSTAETWTAVYPAIRYEHWIESDDVPNLDQAIQEKIHEVLSEKTGIELERHPDYRGNIVVVLEDRRATFTDGEDPHVKLNPELMNCENLAVTVDWEEYGAIVQTTVMDAVSATANGSADVGMLRQLKNIVKNSVLGKVDESAEVGSTDDIDELQSSILITYGDTEFDVALPDVTAPGASDLRIGIRQGGELIDQRRFPLIRIITGNVQLGAETQSESGPPAFYHNSPTDQPGQSFVSGEHVWDNRRIAFGSRSDLGGWCTDADEDIVANAFAAIEADIQETVKLTDPYLSATDIAQFVDLLEADVDVWIITSNLEQVSALEPKLRQYKQAGRSVEILRVMDQNGGPSNTPLHDRFILTGGPRGWALGTSFNTLDENVSLISELPLRIINRLDYQFNSWWYQPVEEKDGNNTCNKIRLGTSQI